MKALTSMELEFIHDTGWRPSIAQFDNWHLCNIGSVDNLPTALAQYHLDYDNFYNKFFGEDCLDSLSFYDEMAYMLSVLYSYEGICKLMKQGLILQACQDWKYYHGARRWTMEDAMSCAADALDILSGYQKVIVTEDNDIMVVDKEVE